MGAFTIFELGYKPTTITLPPLAGACALLILLGAVPLVRAEAPELAVKPQVCALTDEEAICQQQLHIQWRTGKPMRLCLFVDTETAPLACWREQESGAFHYQARTQHSLVFQLRQEPNDQLLASEMFAVIREQPEYRQRRRKPWNFF